MLQPSYHRNINPLRPLALRPHISASMPIHNYDLSIVFPVEICQVIFIWVSVLLSAKPRFIGIVINLTGWGLFSLPNRRKSAEKVENPTSPGRISLPKQWKSAEKGREPHIHRPDISTQTAKIGWHLYFRTVIFYKSCVYMIKYTHWIEFYEDFLHITGE